MSGLVEMESFNAVDYIASPPLRQKLGEAWIATS